MLPPATVPWPNSGALNTVRRLHLGALRLRRRRPRRSRPGPRRTGRRSRRSARRSRSRSTCASRAGCRSACSPSTTAAADDMVAVRRVQRRRRAPPTRRRAGDDCGGDRRRCPQTDEFDGSALDPKWDAREPDRRPTLAVGGGNLVAHAAPGRPVSGANFTARNSCCRLSRRARGRRPRRSIRTRGLTADGEAAGLVLINGSNPNYFAKAAIQYKNDTDPLRPADERQVGGAGADLQQRRDHAAAGGGRTRTPGKLDAHRRRVWVRRAYDGTRR